MAERRQALWAGLVGLVALCLFAACGGGTEVVYLERTGCEACHRPVAPDGTPVGLERAHPPVGGVDLTCTECHGGDPEARRQSEAHVGSVSDDAASIRYLSPRELDQVEPDLLRFVNPGDLRVAPRSCGAGAEGAAGGGCHQDVVDRVMRSPMATLAGELDVTRYRSGGQADFEGMLGIYDAFDPEFASEGAAAPGTVESLRAFEASPVDAAERAVGPFMDQVLAKECLGCHLWSFGANRHAGTFRSSGCTACHMVYSDEGLSDSGDPMLDKGAPPHPLRHELTTAIPTGQCVHCHFEGGRIGPSFQGFRESGRPGSDPVNATPLGQALFGRPPSFYLVDEGGDDEGGDPAVDETPADVHFEAGMHCVDCHVGADVHGDGRIWTEGAAAVQVRCSHCHGTVEEPALDEGESARLGGALTLDDAGGVWLHGRVEDRRWQVPQISAGLASAPEDSPLAQAHGRWPGGGGHTESLTCDACHSGWLPTCYGCHLSLDLGRPSASLLTGTPTPGLVAAQIGVVAIDSLVLMLDGRGRIAPSMPAERVFFGASDGAGSPLLDGKVRITVDGRPGMGQRAFAPHTVRRSGPFSACSRCHPASGEVGDSLARAAAGLGSGRFIVEDGAGKSWQLDQVVDPETLLPTTVVGHAGSFVSSPLPKATIERMLGVRVP